MRRDCQIIVPSKQRTGLMRRLLGLLPEAWVTVDEREMEDYLRVVPEGQLIPHEPVRGMGHLRDVLMKMRQARYVAMMDDDLKAVYSMVGPRRRKLGADEISVLIDNGAQVMWDLGLWLFGWGVTGAAGNPMNYSNCQPFSFHRWVGQGYILDGDMYGKEIGRGGMKFEFLVDAASATDDEMCLRALLGNRVVAKDLRFYWDFGDFVTGAGGGRGVQTAESREAAYKDMRDRWGKYCGPPTGEPSVTVQRKSELAVI